MTEVASSNKNTDAYSDQLVLAIKGLMILNTSDEAVLGIIDRSLDQSHDEQVDRFMRLIRDKKNAHVLESLLTGLGELVLASVLVILGLALLAPSVLGVTSPQQLLSYFQGITSFLSVGALSNPAIPVLELLLALALLLAAFHTLHTAASNLKQVNQLTR